MRERHGGGMLLRSRLRGLQARPTETTVLRAGEKGRPGTLANFPDLQSRPFPLPRVATANARFASWRVAVSIKVAGALPCCVEASAPNTDRATFGTSKST